MPAEKRYNSPSRENLVAYDRVTVPSWYYFKRARPTAVWVRLTITPLLFSRRFSKTRALHLHTIKPRKFVSVTVRSQEQVALVSIREQLYFRNKS